MHIAYIMSHCLASNVQTVEASAAAEENWVAEIINHSRFNQSYQESCTPGYYNNEGKPNPLTIRNGSYGSGPVKFFEKLTAWREEGTMDGLEFNGPPRSG